MCYSLWYNAPEMLPATGNIFGETDHFYNKQRLYPFIVFTDSTYMFYTSQSLVTKSLNRITFYCALLYKDSIYKNLTIISVLSALHRIVELVGQLAYDYEDDFENFKIYLLKILVPQNCRV